MTQSLIFDIKRYAINDGPGIRTVVFFKGCNLHCAWCHNPESISPAFEKLYAVSRCIRCGSCTDACPEDALTLTADGIVTDTGRCTLCGKCADVCPTLAIEMSGKPMAVPEIMEILEKERAFFEQSGGGVTFSGGEPLLHTELLLPLLEECGKRGIHRAVDTAGNVRTETLMAVARHTDLFLYDLKMMETEEHRKWTGSSNALIMENLRHLAETGIPVVIRIPVVAGINDSPENAEQTARFLVSLPGRRMDVHLLPYHAIARHKYAKLGRESDYESLSEPDSESLERMKAIFGAYGISASMGG
jgi:pyruvate formate lyase activating enzyme